MAAFRKAEGFHPEFAEVARLSLSDPYWEVRREGIALIAAFSDHFREDETIAGAVVRRALKPIENFEVRVEAVRAAVMLLPEDDFFRLSGRFTASRAVRLREAVLDAVRIGIRSGRITDRPKARRLLNRVVVTTSDFSPAFRIRERFLSAVKSLEDKP